MVGCICVYWLSARGAARQCLRRRPMQIMHMAFALCRNTACSKQTPPLLPEASEKGLRCAREGYDLGLGYCQETAEAFKKWNHDR